MDVQVTQDGRLLLNGVPIRTPYRVQEAVVSDERAIALYDPDDAPREYGSFANLVAMDAEGSELWKAELPQSPASYYKLVSVDPLVALSWASFRCTIDPATGRILEAQWFK
jgi:hypothetical protein